MYDLRSLLATSVQLLQYSFIICKESYKLILPRPYSLPYMLSFSSTEKCPAQVPAIDDRTLLHIP